MDLVGRLRSALVHSASHESTWRTYGRIDHLSHWSCWDHLVHHSIHTSLSFSWCIFEFRVTQSWPPNIPKTLWCAIWIKHHVVCSMSQIIRRDRHQGISALSQVFTDKIGAKIWLFTILGHPQILILKVFLNSGKKKTSMDSLHLFCFCQTSSQSQGCPWHSAPGF